MFNVVTVNSSKTLAYRLSFLQRVTNISHIFLVLRAHTPRLSIWMVTFSH